MPDTLTPQIYLDDYDSSRALVLQSIVSYIGSWRIVLPFLPTRKLLQYGDTDMIGMISYAKHISFPDPSGCPTMYLVLGESA